MLLTRFVTPGHPDSGRWTLPGGGMAWGESPDTTAVREVREETGFEVVVDPVLGVFSRWYTADESFLGRAGHAVGIVYAARVLGGRLRTVLDGTTDDARWFSAAEVEELPRVELLDFALGLVEPDAG